MSSYVRLDQFLDGKKYILGSIVLIGLFIVFMVSSFAALTPVSIVTVPSTILNYSNKEEGAWQYTKSAEWISKGKARVTINLDTVEKKKSDYTDVILVLDTSGSMYGDKLNQMQDDVISFVVETISKGNKIALITFNDTATIENDFTNSSLLLRRNINNLVANGETNYYQALVKVDDVLSNYTKVDNRDCVVLFLTDGFPTVDTPNEIPQYRYLKTKYEYLSINGIQYEFNTSEILDWVKNVTDAQYVADMESLNEFLYRASISAANYDNLTLTDYVDTDYFNLKNISNINTTFGTASVIDNRVVWDLNGLRSGTTATLTMEINLNDNLVGVGGTYSTHSRTDVSYSIGTTSTTESSTLTPVLKDNYVVNYEANAPDGCVVSNMPSSKSYSVFDIVNIEDRVPTCEGYQFKKWEIVTENVEKMASNYFEMPTFNVTLRAIWKKAGLVKSMNGTVSKVQTLYKLMADNTKGLDTNINLNESLTTANSGVYTRNGTVNDQYPVYYYRGIVDNNNVLFANICWKMVRTTNTGGVKLIYNGKFLEKYSQYTPIVQSKYINVSNDQNYPYTYDSATNKWTSINKENESSSQISFSVSESGNYILSYSVSSAISNDVAYFYKDGVEIGAYSGIESSFIMLENITSSNVITVKYKRHVGSSMGTNSVTFSVDKGFGYITKDCNNTGVSTQIGTSMISSDSTSPSDVGYMYGTRYEYDNYSPSTVDILERVYVPTSSEYYYGTSVKYSNGIYTLQNAENKIWSNNYDNLVGYYTCGNYSTMCSKVRYISGSNDSSMYFLSLSNGVTDATSQTMTFGKSVVDNGNGTYTLSDLVTVQKKNWYDDYTLYKGYYTCRDFTSTTCTNKNYILDTSIYSYSYDTTFGFIYGNDVTWDGSNYHLIDTTTSTNGWSLDRSTLGKKYHYTCLNVTGICTKVYYILEFRDNLYIYYLTLTSGKDIEMAKNEMFSNINSSPIKQKIDSWYQNNMTAYTAKLEDTIWCNDRTFIFGSLVGKDNNAGTYNSNFGMVSINCPNTSRDGFTVSTDSGGNGKLTYPVGLLAYDEVRLAGANGDSQLYLNTGYSWWTLSPSYYGSMNAVGSRLNNSGKLEGFYAVVHVLGVRPSVSLKKNTRYMDGDGTAENPYVIDMDN